MTRRLPALTIVVLLLAACAAVWRAVRSRYEPGRYYDSQKGFSIRFPESWKVKNYDQDRVITGYDPEENRGVEALGGRYKYTNVRVAAAELPRAMGRDEFIRWVLGRIPWLRPLAAVSRVTDWLTTNRKAEQIRLSGSVMPGAGMTRENREIMIAGTSARRITISMHLPPTSKTDVVYFLVKDRRGCVIYCHCAAGPDELASYQPLFESIAQSFRFE